MVRFADTSKLRPETAAVKLEVDDSLEEEHAPENKRSKCSASLSQDACGVLSDQTKYNPLDEPSPLGLRLRKSPSLVELIQMRLSQGSGSKVLLSGGGVSDGGNKKETRAFPSSSGDKIKASNFPATLLKIGSWECASRYEGDLVAKCYFAKRKLVWEVLEGGLKSKIEVQWSDIMDIKASYPENSPGTLEIVIARQPLFFRETNPQPRKHTLWQATSDFTGGQASMHRRHFLQVTQGLLGKHFEKLIQCDSRLYSLSKQPEIVLDSPYFESSRCTNFNDQGGKFRCFDDSKGEFEQPSFPGFLEMSSPSPGPSSSSRSGELRDHNGTPDASSLDAPSPSSAMESGFNEESTSSSMRELRSFPMWDQLKLPGVHPSMSMTDLVNHIENCISQKITASGNSLFPGISVTEKDIILEDITQYLFSDSQNPSSDENSLMSRVNSLCCLLQKEPNTTPTAPSMQRVGESMPSDKRPLFDMAMPEEKFRDDVPAHNLISRKESFGDLMLHLPRIASLPQFFFNVLDDSSDKAR